MKRDHIKIYFPDGDESLLVGKDYEHGILIGITVDYDLGYPAVFLRFSTDPNKKIITHEISIIGIPYKLNTPKNG